MDPRYYLSHEAFEREQAVLFGRLWQFFTLKPLLARPHAFVVRRIAGREVVVQNFDGELRAFENVCLHRQAPLQTEREGVRPLVCRYHAWRYGPDGRPDTIPFHDELYQYDPARRRALCLPRFALEVVGNLVFVNVADAPIPLTDQYDPAFLESLRVSSESYDTEVAITTFHGRFNWKLAYENLRDAHHPRFVHPRTLAKFYSFEPRVNAEELAEVQALRAREGELDRSSAMALLRRFSFGGKEAELPELRRYEWHDKVAPWQPEPGYWNWLAYPNLHIAAPTGGHAFTIEHHVPVSATQTDLVLYWVTARRTEPYPAGTAVLHANMLGAQRVLSEDIQLVEQVQRALNFGSPRAELGAYESLNQLVESWYDDLMEGRFVV
jgi:phenylpropionate dioxygenase-like ring-hydroxylating dioxygenase large terminal subunit